MNKNYSVRPVPQRHHTVRRHRGAIVVFCTILLLITIYAGYALLRPLPAPKITITPPVTPALVKVNIPWPAAGQAAYGASGYGLLASNGAQTPVPTASVAKVLTALAVLQKKPLQNADGGPLITLGQKDVDLYNKYVAQDGSVVPVTGGQTISEYQALQAMMLPSANNIADSLANWAFGDMASYTAFANTYVRKLGMAQTTISDASGFAPQTVSTASDLVKLGLAARQNSVLSDIASQKSAIFPGFGPIYNVDSLLGQSGINGLKTGNTDEAGGVFLGTADVVVGSQTVKVVTAVMNAPNLGSALRSTVPLVQSTPAQFHVVHVVSKGQSIGTVTAAWGASSKVIADKDISVTVWSGTTLPAVKSHTALTSHLQPGSTVGSLQFNFQDTVQMADMMLVNGLGQASVRWRLEHPF